jgi:N-methylhydantoinase A
VSVVVGEQPSITPEGQVGRHPVKIPMVDVVTVGAGGGSIASVSAEGTLKVGPRSAGADPGPICYGTGGTEPTVTDAVAYLGRIPPHLLGGQIPLDVPAAADGLGKLAERLGLTTDDAASGILEISAWNQANAIRQVTAARSHAATSCREPGGSGSPPRRRLVDILPVGFLCRDPGKFPFGLLTVDGRNYADLSVRTRPGLDPRRAGIRPGGAGRGCARPKADRSAQVHLRSVDLLRSGVEVRVDAGPARRDKRQRARRLS